MNDKDLLEKILLRLDLLLHDKQYRFRNQDNTWYSRESCKDISNDELLRELDIEFTDLSRILEEYETLPKNISHITDEIFENKNVKTTRISYK
jgi:hypothetical protein